MDSVDIDKYVTNVVDNDEGVMHIFGFASLIYFPGFTEFDSRIVGKILGYERRFTRLSYNLGTPQWPARVATLVTSDPVNEIWGVVYRITDPEAKKLTWKHLYEREVRNGYFMQRVPFHPADSQKPFPCEFFIAYDDSPGFLPDASVSLLAYQILHAKGPMNRNILYFTRLAEFYQKEVPDAAQRDSHLDAIIQCMEKLQTERIKLTEEEMKLLPILPQESKGSFQTYDYKRIPSHKTAPVNLEKYVTNIVNKRDGVMHIFGYASLVYFPGFDKFDTRIVGKILGYERRFTRLTYSLGTSQWPARVATLVTADPFSEIWGVVYRISDPEAKKLAWKHLYDREVLNSYAVLRAPFYPTESQKPFTCEFFIAYDNTPGFLPDAPIPLLAYQILHANGPLNSNVWYVNKLGDFYKHEVPATAERDFHLDAIIKCIEDLQSGQVKLTDEEIKSLPILPTISFTPNEYSIKH